MRCMMMLLALCALATGCETVGHTRKAVAKTSTEVKVPAGALTITDANFDETIKDGVVLVDFWATWCPPCRTQGPIVEKVAAAYAGKAVVGKLDVDKNKATTKRFGIKGIPTLIIFKDGKEVQRFVGLRKEADLKAALDKQL